MSEPKPAKYGCGNCQEYKEEILKALRSIIEYYTPPSEFDAWKEYHV